MTTQLVKKKFGGKRKGYRGTKWDTAKSWGTKGATVLGGGYGLTLLDNILKIFGGKDGGRVTPRGIGVAKRGYGKAMRKRK